MDIDSDMAVSIKIRGLFCGVLTIRAPVFGLILGLLMFRYSHFALHVVK